MRIAFLGYGKVGAPLADHLQRAGHDVVLAANEANPEGAAEVLARNPKLALAAAAEAVRDADVVVLAVPFPAVTDVLTPLAALLAGKVLVDVTNPVGPGLRHGLGSARSGSEMVAELVPGASVVKAFSVYGFEHLQDNSFPGSPMRPMMPIAGDDAAAKEVVAGLAADIGWEPLDVGGLAQALHLEHMTLLWITMVRAGGLSPHLAWAALRR
jgi:hypothetical protein